MNISRERKLAIHNYLLEYGCSPTAKGFSILADVIGIAALNPLYSCKELFEEYIRVTDGYTTTSASGWKIPYKTARYCYLKSGASAQGVYEFIKCCAVAVELLPE